MFEKKMLLGQGFILLRYVLWSKGKEDLQTSFLNRFDFFFFLTLGRILENQKTSKFIINRNALKN